MSKPTPATNTTTTTRRRKGSGSIIQQNGTYYGMLRHGKSVKKVKLCANRREAESMWAAWIRDHAAAIEEQAGKHPITEVAGLTRAHYQGVLSERELENTCTEIGAMMERLTDLGIKYLEDVSADVVAAYYAQRAGADMALRTRQYIRTRLRRAWDAILPARSAEIWGRCQPKGDKSNISRRPLSQEQVKALLAATEKTKHPAEYRALVMIALHTGLRLVDCVHLRPADIHDGVIDLVPRKTANKSGTRVQIPVSNALQETLAALPVGEYYLPQLVKLYRKTSLFAYYLRQLFKKAGIETSVAAPGRARAASVQGFHALRATFVSSLAERHVGLGLIQSLAGHVGPSQTMAYCHPQCEALKAAIATLPGYDEIGDVAIQLYRDPVVEETMRRAQKMVEEAVDAALDARGLERTSGNVLRPETVVVHRTVRPSMFFTGPAALVLRR